MPAIWGPILLGLFACSSTAQLSLAAKAALLVCGGLLWQAIEYSLHRFAFHAPASSYGAITLHFMFHGCHHKFPNDPDRLVFPPLPAAAIASSIWGALRLQLTYVRPLDCPATACPRHCCLRQGSSARSEISCRAQTLLWPCRTQPCASSRVS